jgi:tetratricopeptide (TPR) repeat protein
MKSIKCFITFKSAVINDVSAAINPPLTVEEFGNDIASIRLNELNEQKLRDFGIKLFQRIFTDNALEQYKSSDPSAIALSVSDNLASIPWELLHDGTNWVARTRGIVRVAITGRNTPDFIQKQGNLRILTAIAGPILNETMPDDDPEQIHPLSFRRVTEEQIDVNAHTDIFKKLEGEPFPADIKIRKHVTRESLSWELSDNYQVLHFVGHGAIGRLVFETRHASVDLAEEIWIREQITTGLRGGLRLVVLNSCHSADASEIYGIANTLMETGLPALIAMQGSISELADLTFVKNLYNALATGKPIDEAVSIARRAMASDWQIPVHEWATPVLFLNDSLLDKDMSIMDAESLELLPEPKTKLSFPQQAPIDPMMTREQKFVGRRRELSDVLISLDPERRDGVQVVCLQGEAGIGKTAIAIESAYRMAEWFSDLIWLSGHADPPKELREHTKADDPLKRINSPVCSSVTRRNEKGFLTDLAHKCGLELTGDETEAELRDNILKSLSGNKWKLLVFDSMESLVKSDAIRSLLSNLPINCKALITSREPLEINERQIHVSMMKQVDSIKLLVAYGSIKGLQIDVNELSQIVHFTGGQPMAMRLVVSQVTSGEKTLESVLKDLKKACTLFDYIFSNSLKLALKDGRKLFAVMSLFYPTASRKALQEVCKLNDDAFDKAMKRVIGLSLVESYQQGKRLGLHQMAKAKAEQVFAEDQDKDKYQERMAEYFMEFLNATVPMTQPDTATKAIEPQMPEGMTKRQIQEVAMEMLVKPALNMMETELDNCLLSMELMINKGDLNTAMKFSDNLVDFLVIRGYWDVAKYYITKMSKAFGERGENELRAKTIYNLGILSHKQGKWKDAIDAYETALKVAHEFQNSNLEANSLNELGIIYIDQGNTDKAIECIESAMTIYQSIGDNVGKAGLLNDLGRIYQNKNEWEKAFQYYIDSRDIFIQQNDKRGEATALGNIGLYYQSKQKYEDAIKFYEDSLKIFIDLGLKVDQANLITKIGSIYHSLGHLNEALQYYNNSLNIERELGNLVGQYRALRDISLAYAVQNNWVESTNACIESYQIASQIYANIVIDSLKGILVVSKIMLKSGELAAPIQLGIELTYFIKKVEIQDDEMRAALAISEGVFTIIGFIAACGWDKTSDVYKEALELAKSLDESTGSALKLVEWLE